MMQVAVKIVKKASVMRYRACRRLCNEIALTALVDSDHVCKLLETVHTRGAASSPRRAGSGGRLGARRGMDSRTRGGRLGARRGAAPRRPENH